MSAIVSELSPTEFQFVQDVSLETVSGFLSFDMGGRWCRDDLGGRFVKTKFVMLG